jgi:hypothetical protein
MKNKKINKVKMKRIICALTVSVLGLVASAGSATNVVSKFDTLGVMLDVSRGRVLKVDYLKKRFERLQKMGYNAVMLYCEDTFKLDGEPMWGYMRGGYGEEEIKSLKAHACTLGITMIPCIETLGHLEEPLRWRDYADIRNTRATLLVGEEKTYALLEKIIAFWAKSIGGKRIHVGMDEAFGFAGSKYEKKNGKRPHIDVFLEHLKRVNEICGKYGFTEPIIWSDMLYRIASKTHDYYDPEAKADPTLSNRIPKNVKLCYWDYYHSQQSYYEGMIDGHRSLGSEPMLAGGIQLWHHFLHDREKTLATMTPMVAAAKKKGIKEFFFTVWGDYGSYGIPDVAEEGLFACAELAAGRTAEPTDENRARFKAITGMDYRSLAKLGDVNRHYADEWPDMIHEGDILYDDPLYCGNLRNYLVRKPSEVTDRRFYCATYKDSKWRDDGEKVIEDYLGVLGSCENLRGVPPVAGDLVRTLKAKLNYERDILAAWKKKDRAVIERIYKKDLPQLIGSMKKFMKRYRADWYRTSQPFGFERVQKRNAIALARLEEARLRIGDYLSGRASTIEEFDEAMKPFGKYNSSAVIQW